MQILPGSLRYALRQFRLSPVFTAAAVLTLALGIGGTTAIFTLIHAVMLRSLPVSDPGRLYRVGEGDECCVEGGLRPAGACFPSLCTSASRQKPRNSKRLLPSRPGAGGWAYGVRVSSRLPGHYA